MSYVNDIFYYIELYRKKIKLLIFLIIISMVIAWVISQRQPVTYVSRATFLTADGGSSESSSLGKFLGLSGFSGGSSSNELIISILKSNRMASDISRYFKLDERPDVRWELNTFRVLAGLGVEIRGSDPAITEKIANFSILNLDSINAELNITPNKPMVKVLDPAVYGSKEPKQTKKNMLIAGMFTFLLASFFIFMVDSLNRMKASISKQSAR